MQIFRPFPLCFFEKWPEPQNVTRVKITPKLEKSTDPNYNLISPEGQRDTAACKISGHFLNAFSRKCPETPHLTRFTKSKQCQNKKNQQTTTII